MYPQHQITETPNRIHSAEGSASSSKVKNEASSQSSPSASVKPSTRGRATKTSPKATSNHQSTPAIGSAPSYARAYRSRKTVSFSCWMSPFGANLGSNPTAPFRFRFCSPSLPLLSIVLIISSSSLNLVDPFPHSCIVPKRPCDLCRKRKSRCVIEVPNAPCLSCSMYNKECTFVGPTTKRKRPSSGPASTSAATSTSASTSKSSSTDTPQIEPVGLTRRASIAATNRFEPYPSGVVANSSGMEVDSAKARRLSFAPDPPSRSSKSASTVLSPYQFNDLVATLVNGDTINEDFMDDASDTSSNERAPIEEQGLTPFVLGSSSDMREDPVLKRPTQANANSSGEGTSRMISKAGSHHSSSRSSSSAAGTRPVQAFEVRQVTRDINKPVFFAFIPSNPYGRSHSKGKEFGASSYEALRQLLRGKIATLMALYSQRDAPAFPVLSNSQRQAFRLAAVSKPQGKVSPVVGSSSSNASTSQVKEETEVPLPNVLSISTLATATVYDHSLRTVSRQAWGYNLHALKDQFEVTSLVTIQIALTDLTGRPSINNQGNVQTLALTYALAHMLGLHLDSTTWHFPKEERDLRTRLFWGLLIHDKFSALCWGRPSIIHEADYTVPLPSRTPLSPCREHLDDSSLASFDFGADTSSYVQSLRTHANAGCRESFGSGDSTSAPMATSEKCFSSVHLTHTPGDTFVGLCRLSLILSDVLREFHSVRASYGPRRDSFSVVQSVKAYLVRLDDWKAVLPPSLKLSFETKNDAEDIPGTSSLQLSYFGVLLLLCRTSLEAVTANETLDESRIFPAHEMALHAANQVVEFVEALTPTQYNGFWFHYGSHHLASCLSLLSRLILGFTHLDEPQLLASAIRSFETLFRLLVEARRVWLWDLAELSLTRCKAILPALEEKLPSFPKLLHLLDNPQIPQIPRPSTTSSITSAQPSSSTQAQNSNPNSNYQPYSNHPRAYSNDGIQMRSGGYAADPSSSSAQVNFDPQQQQQQYRPVHPSHYNHNLQYESHQRSQSLKETGYQNHHPGPSYPHQQHQQQHHGGFTVMGQAQPGNRQMYPSHSQAGLPPGLSLDPASLAAVGLGDWGIGGLTNFGNAMPDPTQPQTWNTDSNQAAGSSVEGWMPVDLGWFVNAKGNEGGS